jgi:hypothetical protein
MAIGYAGLGELNAELVFVGPGDFAALQRLVIDQIENAGNSVGGLYLQTGARIGKTSDGAWHLAIAERNFSRFKLAQTRTRASIVHGFCLQNILK